MNSDFSCPSCGHPMAIPAHRAGTTLYCTACNAPFVVTADDGSWYQIASLGRDKLPGDRVGGPTTDFDCDLVWANGQFIQWPEGIQTR